jgi:hypothetical protein
MAPSDSVVGMSAAPQPIPAGPVSHGPPPPDALARAGAIAIAAGRIGIGIGALAVTRPALRTLGFDDPHPATVVLARMAGVRDVALGIHALTVMNDTAKLREASVIGAVVDAGDAFAFGAALVGREGIDAMALKNLPIAGSAVLAGAFVASRLKP